MNEKNLKQWQEIGIKKFFWFYISTIIVHLLQIHLITNACISCNYRLIALETHLKRSHKATDQMVIAFRSRHSRKMYMLVKWGNKVCCRAGISGYIYEFQVCIEKCVKALSIDLQNASNFGESE